MAIRHYNPNAKPPVTLALVGINVAIALIDMFSGGYLERLFYARGIDIQYGQYWRVFTSAWVHADLIHIAFNAFGLYILGNIVERVMGLRALLVVYFVSLFGGTGLALTFGDSTTPLLGASGAVYGLFGAVLGYFYTKTGSIRGILEIPMGRMLLLWLGLNIWISVTDESISFLGHAGGFVAGTIFGVYFEHRYMRQLDVYHRLSAVLVLAVVLAMSAFSMFPVTRASWYASQALRAYEHDDFERGDELMDDAESRNMRDEGTRQLITHLKLWRVGNEALPRKYDRDVLRLPLTHVEPVYHVESSGRFGTRRHAVGYTFIDPAKVEPWLRDAALGKPAVDDIDSSPEDEPPEPVESPTDDE